jgi:hypothetical protein
MFVALYVCEKNNFKFSCHFHELVDFLMIKTIRLIFCTFYFGILTSVAKIVKIKRS